MESPSLAGHSKHDFEMMRGTVTLLGDDNGDFVRLRVDRGGATPYKWNEAVVLLAASELGKGARPAMVYGVSNSGAAAGEGAAENRKECVVYVRLTEEAKKVVRTGKVVYAYSLTPFTSFIRWVWAARVTRSEFSAVTSLKRKRNAWGNTLVARSNDTLPAHITNTHIPAVGVSFPPHTQALYTALAHQLNPYQMNVVAALSRPGLTGAYLVEGPPGTGKTTTVISLVQALLAINTVGPRRRADA